MTLPIKLVEQILDKLKPQYISHPEGNYYLCPACKIQSKGGIVHHIDCVAASLAELHREHQLRPRLFISQKRDIYCESHSCPDDVPYDGPGNCLMCED